MTFEEIKKILEKENFNTAYYSIFDKNTRSGDGVVVEVIEDKYNVYLLDRQEPFNLKIFENENEACIEFLKQCDVCFYKKYNLSKYYD